MSIDGVDLAVWTNFGSWIVNAIAVVIVPYLIGRATAVRRELVESYRIRAEHAEAEGSARVAESILLERTRIAREAHDVLGHKLSLLTMEAGGLELNVNVETKVIEDQAQLIKQSAQDALDDLRVIIRSIDPPNTLDVEGVDHSLVTQDLSGIRKLMDESARSGAIVKLVTTNLFHPDELPDNICGVAHRVVQECLSTVDNVNHVYGKRMALEIISFSLDSGAIVGLVGVNGSGKSTLLRILAGVQRATSDRVVQFGPDLSLPNPWGKVLVPRSLSAPGSSSSTSR